VVASEAQQPMQAPTGDVIFFNGDIYNHVELRQQLAAHWAFKTQSDTEVILASYRTYGTECIQLFHGMFAFVIWDGEKLFAARDQFGIKPFYYTIQNQCFIFASESKALLPFLPNIRKLRTQNPTQLAPQAARSWDRSGKRHGSTLKAEEKLSFKAQMSLAIGLEKTVAWTKAQMPLIQKSIDKHRRYH